MALIAGGLHTGDEIPFWVRAAAATAMGARYLNWWL